MGKRGPRPQGNVKIKWSANFAYAIGLLVTDGCLYNDERHICFVSKDLEQVKHFMDCLGIRAKVGASTSGFERTKTPRVQVSDVNFYKYLISIGITPAKSKTIGKVDVPQKYFFDFLRGCFDGDGCFYSYWDKRWKSSYMFYLTFSSASKKHIDWIRSQILEMSNMFGHISKSRSQKSIYNLRYAKKESLVLIKKMYYNRDVVCLSRKKIKIQKALTVEKKQQAKYS